MRHYSRLPHFEMGASDSKPASTLAFGSAVPSVDAFASYIGRVNGGQPHGARTAKFVVFLAGLNELNDCSLSKKSVPPELLDQVAESVRHSACLSRQHL